MGELLVKEALDSNVKRKISEGILITGPEAKIKVPEQYLRSFLAFESGLVLVATGESGSNHVRSMIRNLRKEISGEIDVHEVRSEIILEIYEENNTTKSQGQQKEIEVHRQKLIRDLISTAFSRKASDIHIIVGKEGHTNIWFRSYGRRMFYTSIPNTEAMMMIEAIFAVARDVVGESAMNLRQGALDNVKASILPRGLQMIRLQYTPQNNGRGALVMRLIPESSSADNDISKLGYSDQHLEDFAMMRRRTNGLYVLAGKVSSGKTTTLQRTLNTMYQEKNREILIFTIEDPVELELEDAIQMVAKAMPDPHNKGKTIDGFEAGIASLLRSDANVGVLGEIRLASTAQRAIEAVMTGHALWTTVHTGSALRILGRLLDLGVEPYKLADPDIVAGLIYQRLVGTMCPCCRVPMPLGYKHGLITGKLAKRTEAVTGVPAHQLFVRGNGTVPDPNKDPIHWEKCPGKCMNGLNGRTVVAEVVRPDEKLLADFARTKDQVAARIYWSTPVSKGGLGGKPTIHHALTKVGAGLVDINEVEEEVNFVETYIKEYKHLIPDLHKDVRDMIQKRKEAGK